jgi:hypothetical protein
MITTQHTENQVVSKKPTLFGRFKTFINSKPVGCTYTTRELMMTVGIHETSSYWKRSNRNPHYTTALYQSKLKDWGCLTHVKRGIWKINGHIPTWFSTFHFEFVDSADHYFNPRRTQCMYWQSLPAEYKVNPWMDVLAARLRKAINKVDQMKKEAKTVVFNTAASNAIIFNDADTADYGMHAFESITFSPVAGLPTAVANVVVGAKRANDGLYECWVEDLMDINWVDGAVASAHITDRMGETWKTQTAWAVMRNLMGDDEFNVLKERLCAAAVERTFGRLNAEVNIVSGPKFADLVEYMKDTVKSSIEDNLCNIEDDVELDLGYDKQISVSVDTSSIAREIANTVVDSIECWMDDNGAK